MSKKQRSESCSPWFYVWTALLAGVFSNFDYHQICLSVAELFLWIAPFFDK